MNLEQGLELIKANYSVVSIVDNDTEVIVTTLSDIKLAEAAALNRLGWVVRNYNVVAYAKPELPPDAASVLAPLEPEPPEGELLLSITPPDQPDSSEND